MKLPAPRKGHCCPQFSLATHIHTYANTYMGNHAQNLEIFTLSPTGNPTPPKQPAFETCPAGSLCRMAIVRSHSQAGHYCKCSLEKGLGVAIFPTLIICLPAVSVSHGGDNTNHSEMHRPHQTGRGSCTLQQEVLSKTAVSDLPYQSKEMCEPW